MARILIKSKYHAEFKRYSIKDDFGFKKFEEIVKEHHNLHEIPFLIFYTDPIHGDLLPINNDENFAKAKSVQKSILKIVLQAKGESYNGLNDFNKKRNFFDNLNNLLTQSNTKTPKLEINLLEDFHQVSSIIDADVLPKTCRRVKITKHGSDKPLGFFIRDGYSVRLTPKGLQKVPAIFISRVLAGGLAESTGLLAVNDEVLEVNGIDVLGKSIEQVTDMMVANASNLILTIKPACQNHLNDSFISTRSTILSNSNSHKPIEQLNSIKMNNVLQTNALQNSFQSTNLHHHQSQRLPYSTSNHYNSLRNNYHSSILEQSPIHHQQENRNSNQINLRQHQPIPHYVDKNDSIKIYQNISTSSRNYFDVEEPDSESEEDEQDEIKNYVTTVKNFDKLKLKNAYQNNNLSSNQVL